MKPQDISPEDVRDGVRTAGEHPIVEQGARVGYAASGVLHLLLAWLALRLAWGDYGGEADQTQAFESVSGIAAGVALLVVLALGFVLLALWNLAEAVILRGQKTDSIKHVAKGITYGVLAWGAFEVIGNQAESGAEKSEDATAEVMGNALGNAAVVIVGLGVIGVGAYHVYKGVAKKYCEDLTRNPGRAVEVLGTFGYAAKGVALGIVGGLFVAAVVTSDPEKASGMDGALRALLQLPFGPWLLSLVALGLVAYGLYSFARAKYTKV